MKLIVATIISVLAWPALAQEVPKPPEMVMIDGESTLHHDFTQLPLTGDGWTDFQGMVSSQGYADARVVFVSSSSGNDSTASIYARDDIFFDDRGMFQSSGAVKAFKTIASAYSQIRRGYPDILLLQRGDEWSEGFTTTGAGRVKSGRNVLERHVIASYGSGDRPKLFASAIDARDASYSIVTGLHLYENDWRTAGRALEVTGAVNHQLYEDMRFDQKSKDMIQGGSATLSNVAIRRSFYSHYQGHDGFFYVARVDGLLFEENVFFEPWQRDYPDESRHGRHLYLSPSESGDDKNGLLNLTARGNIFYRGERDGADFRGGGAVENNLFLQTDGLLVGGRGGSQNSIQSARVTRNVFMQGPPNTGRANTANFYNIDGGEISENIWTDPRGNGSANTLLFTGVDVTYIMRNITVANNIVYNYRTSGAGARAVDLSGAFTEIVNFVVRDNDFQYGTGSAEIIRHRDWVGSGGDRFRPFRYEGNRYYTTDSAGAFSPGSNYSGWLDASGEAESQFVQVSYPEPGRTVDTYMRSLGLDGGAEAFMELALGQSRANWNSNYTATGVNAYIRAGFGLRAN